MAGDSDAEMGATTSAFCDGVRESVAHLSTAVDAYRDGDADAFHAAAAEAAGAESACDEYVRDLRGHLVDLDPEFTGVYLQARDLLELLTRLDDVANAVEDALAALASMEPDLSGVADGLCTLCDHALLAATRLCEAVEAYVGALCAGETPGIDRDALDDVGELEHRCDDLKREALAAAFAPGLSVNGLAAREVTLALDGVPNRIEDGAEYLAFVAGETVV